MSDVDKNIDSNGSDVEKDVDRGQGGEKRKPHDYCVTNISEGTIADLKAQLAESDRKRKIAEEVIAELTETLECTSVMLGEWTGYMQARGEVIEDVLSKEKECPKCHATGHHHMSCPTGKGQNPDGVYKAGKGWKEG